MFTGDTLATFGRFSGYTIVLRLYLARYDCLHPVVRTGLCAASPAANGGRVDMAPAPFALLRSGSLGIQSPWATSWGHTGVSVLHALFLLSTLPALLYWYAAVCGCRSRLPLRASHNGSGLTRSSRVPLHLPYPQDVCLCCRCRDVRHHARRLGDMARARIHPRPRVPAASVVVCQDLGVRACDWSLGRPGVGHVFHRGTSYSAPTLAGSAVLTIYLRTLSCD